MNFKIAKFAAGNRLSNPRKAMSLQLRSALTSIFILDIELLVPAISSNSVIISGSNNGGRRFEKKSFSAVATALTEKKKNC